MTTSTASPIQNLRSAATRGQLLVAEQANLNELQKDGIQHEHLPCATGTLAAGTEIVIGIGGACGHLTLLPVQSIAQKPGRVNVPFGAES